MWPDRPVLGDEYRAPARTVECRCATDPDVMKGDTPRDAHWERALVTLDPESIAEVQQVTAGVRDNYARLELPEAVGDASTNALRTLFGMGGEKAASLALGIPWNRGDSKKADLGVDIEVRTTRMTGSIGGAPGPHLRLYSDQPSHPDHPGHRRTPDRHPGRRYVAVQWIGRWDFILWGWHHGHVVLRDGVGDPARYDSQCLRSHFLPVSALHRLPFLGHR